LRGEGTERRPCPEMGVQTAPDRPRIERPGPSPMRPRSGPGRAATRRGSAFPAMAPRTSARTVETRRADRGGPRSRAAGPQAAEPRSRPVRGGSESCVNDSGWGMTRSRDRMAVPSGEARSREDAPQVGVRKTHHPAPLAYLGAESPPLSHGNSSWDEAGAPRRPPFPGLCRNRQHSPDPPHGTAALADASAAGSCPHRGFKPARSERQVVQDAGGGIRAGGAQRRK
jgi:hypothetical protein